MKPTKTEIKLSLKSLLNLEKKMIDNNIKIESFIQGLILAENYGKYTKYSNISLYYMIEFLENNWEINKILDDKIADYIGETIMKRITKKEIC